MIAVGPRFVTTRENRWHRAAHVIIVDWQCIVRDQINLDDDRYGHRLSAVSISIRESTCRPIHEVWPTRQAAGTR